MPLNFGYRFDVFENGGFSVFTGPELCIGITDKYSTPHLDEVGDHTEGIDRYGKNGDMRRFDVAWQAGVGFYFANWQINVTTAFGMLDLHKNDARFHENRLNVALGYNF